MGRAVLAADPWYPALFRPEPAVTQAIKRDALYRRRRFPRDVIETCVRWYLIYSLTA
jgi:hypothetical protein